MSPSKGSQELTTVITPFGQFKYLHAPYGLSSIAEHYNRRMAEPMEGLSGYRRIVDDIVIYDKDPQQHIVHVKQFLQRCKHKQITINREKLEVLSKTSHICRVSIIIKRVPVGLLSHSSYITVSHTH